MGRAGPGPVDKSVGFGGSGLARALSIKVRDWGRPGWPRPANSGKLWLAQCVRCVGGSTRRGLTRGEESEEGGDSVQWRQDPLPFFDVFGGSKNRCKNGTQKVTKIVSKRDPNSEPKSPKWAPKNIPK